MQFYGRHLISTRNARLSKELMLVLLLVCLAGGCSRTVPDAVSAAQDSGTNLNNETQFVNVSRRDAESIWVVTRSGDLMLVSKSGERRKSNILGAVVVASFIDQSRGWSADTKGRIWQTSDGGDSWFLISTKPIDGFYMPQHMIFHDDLHGWIVGLFTVWQTVDGGKTWQISLSISEISEPRVGRLYRGAFVDRAFGWLASSGPIVIRTTDAGRSWNTVAVSSDVTDLHDIFFVDQNTGWAIGRPHGGIYSTEDGGTTWREKLASSERSYLNSIFFVDRNEGWAVGWRSSGLVDTRTGIVLHTTDGGKSWSHQAIGEAERFLNRVTFYDNLRGWLIARDNIYFTQDAGKNWVKVLSLAPVRTSIVLGNKACKGS